MRAAVVLMLALAAAPAPGATFTVTNANDSGAGSLRQAILDANGHSGVDDIAFSIAGSGVHQIVLQSKLPIITDPVTIDGFTQPGAAANTNPVGQGLNATLEIEVTRSGAGTDPCFTVVAGNSSILAMIIQGLVIEGCGGPGILIAPGGDGAFVVGNYIGTDPAGAAMGATQSVGVQVVGANGVVVGGETPGERNLLSGSAAGVEALTSTGTVVAGNLIGTDAAGTSAIVVPSGAGVRCVGCASVRIGGSAVAARNVISGHPIDGITLDGADAVTIEGNFIGTDVTGTTLLHAQTNGVRSVVDTATAVIRGNVFGGNLEGIRAGAGSVIQGNFVGTDLSATLDLGNADGILFPGSGTTIGGVGAGEGNVIAYNITGVYVGPDQTGVVIRGNRIFGNALLGIDLYDDLGLPGVSPNDSGDADAGGNLLQNFPLITSVVPGASTTHVEGRLNSAASTTYDVDLYSNPHCLRRPHDFVQGETWLGTLPVTTDASGNATFASDVPFVLDDGELVTATATDPGGNTSEFSQRIVFETDPISGSASGGTSTTISGMLFEPGGATVTVGGVAATNVDVQSEFAIVATMPALPPGSLNDVTVTTPSGLSGTLRNGWLADFSDVPTANQFHDFVSSLVTNGVSAGIGGGLYGVADGVLRSQMAVFLLKALHGVCYVPPPCTGVFPDVACPSLFADWIEALAAEGITGGCGGGNYCPGTPVRRDQMAAFLLKAAFGPTYVPPPCTGVFDDVPCPSLFADWIERIATLGITAGCGNGNYCPFSNNTRGQMAVFVVKTFNLQ